MRQKGGAKGRHKGKQRNNGVKRFSDGPSLVRQCIYEHDETKQWSAAISSWTEDERLLANLPDTSLLKENDCCSVSGQTQDKAASSEDAYDIGNM